MSTFATEPVRTPPGPRRAWWEVRRIQVLLIASAFLVGIFLWLAWSLPLGRSLQPLSAPTLVLVTADGKPFARRGAYKEAPVDPARLPRYVPAAFVAIEDRRFYRHQGVDAWAIARALAANLRQGGVTQGGSTLTQQLAKNAFLSNERSLRRKAQEAIIALYVETRLSKDEILSRYLSSVYFGDGVFGLRAAARHYFDKAPEQLSVGEAAMLAGMIKAPTRLAPTTDFPAAQRRMRVVLAAMAEQGLISPQTARRAAAEVRVREGRASLPVGSYFADWISPQVRAAFNRAYGEVTVWTTLDSQLQLRAQEAVNRGMAGAASLAAGQAALVAMRTDGRVVAMVGGKNYRESPFNRAVQAERQPGSAFKLFVYLAALRSGMTPDSLVLDAPVKIGNWSPENHEGRYAGGPVPLWDAFARSSNVAAARLVQQVGVSRVMEAARDLGVTSELPNDATIALGTGSLSLLELTSAYAAVAAGGAPVLPRGLLTQEDQGRATTLNPRDRAGLLNLLRGVVERGTGQGANLGPQVFGKTGTSQDYRDAWFVGFAGDLVVGVWVGNDDNTPMKQVTGGSIPARIFSDFMSYAMRRSDFKAPLPQVSEELFTFGEAVPEGELETFPQIEGELTVPDDEPFPEEAAPPTVDVDPAPLRPPPAVRPEPLEAPTLREEEEIDEEELVDEPL